VLIALIFWIWDLVRSNIPLRQMSRFYPFAPLNGLRMPKSFIRNPEYNDLFICDRETNNIFDGYFQITSGSSPGIGENIGLEILGYRMIQVIQKTEDVIVCGDGHGFGLPIWCLRYSKIDW